MFDIGFWEIAVIAAIMLVVLGPERLPGVARTAGFWLSKIRRMVNDVKTEVKREMDAAELKELEDAKNQIQEASKTVQQQVNQDILTDTKSSLENSKSTAEADVKSESTEIAESKTPDQVSQSDQPAENTETR
jgi:sec-independent protein translocase protein TatB